MISLGRNLALASVMIILILQTGCTDIKETQDLNYATAIGVDYRDGKYHTYIQLVDLMKVAKTEGVDSSPAKMWVSKAEGEIFIDSFFEIYKTAQERFVWAHVTAIVLTEAALQEGFQEIFDGLTRYHEFRLTPWVYGTNESIEDILSVQGFFGQTSLNTILHHPESIFQQSSVLKPIQLFELARQVYEPAYTANLPSLSINKSQWMVGEKQEAKLYLNGAYFIKNDQYKGFFAVKEIKGLRWTTPEMERIQVMIPNEEGPSYLVVFEDPKVKFVSNGPKVDIVVNVKGNLANRERNKNLKLTEMKQLCESIIKKEIEGQFDLGIQEETDFLNLEHVLYRESWNAWRKDPKLAQSSLNKVKVNVDIVHSGALTNRMIEIKDLD
ncbi:Ger(x)C family spore germination protein [Mesobacillus subterraneus]|uniref:Ger(x)C family spore germination protein n=1 Tax=Mesobacillus subterraneus TaxID=285983 RepID=UPI0020411F36|nr:Ger(x)C family spore germination protein [Mesobacillus subterraneus]MCM3575322.1 Ger(x)C family spore germination protein [Mesobacillus subterraneus]